MRSLLGSMIIVTMVMMAMTVAPTSVGAAQQARVEICHFRGHSGDFLIEGANTVGLCETSGGRVITVARPAARNHILKH